MIKCESQCLVLVYLVFTIKTNWLFRPPVFGAKHLISWYLGLSIMSNLLLNHILLVLRQVTLLINFIHTYTYDTLAYFPTLAHNLLYIKYYK